MDWILSDHIRIGIQILADTDILIQIFFNMNSDTNTNTVFNLKSDTNTDIDTDNLDIRIKGSFYAFQLNF
jgi:hypothetical protein